MANAAQPGFTRCFFTANYACNIDSLKIKELKDRQSVVLCIDRVARHQKDSNPDIDAMADVVANRFEAAIALAEQDPLLQYVASWLQQDLEWLPLDLSQSLAVDVTLSSADSAKHRIGLSFSHGGHVLPPPPPAELDDLVEVREHQKTLSVCLAQLCLSADDQQRLQPGSCIVLPETFKQTTNLDLFDRSSEVPVTQVLLDRGQNLLMQMVDGSLSESGSTVQGENLDPIASTTKLTVRVFLQQPVTVDMSSSDSRIEIEPLVGQVVVVQCSAPDGVAEYEAQLIEVGSGLAAVLESAE